MENTVAHVSIGRRLKNNDGVTGGNPNHAYAHSLIVYRAMWVQSRKS